MRLQYTPQAIADLQEIQTYIRHDLQNPQAATRISKTILDSCAMLKDHPKIGFSLQAKIDRETDLRCLVIGNYLAFYRAEGGVISVARILDGRQDYLQILFSNSKIDDQI